MTKTYKKRKQKRKVGGTRDARCKELERKNCNVDSEKRLKTCTNQERQEYVMYCCESGHTADQIEQLRNIIVNYSQRTGLTRVKSRRRRPKRKRKRKRGRSAKR